MLPNIGKSDTCTFKCIYGIFPDNVKVIKISYEKYYYDFLLTMFYIKARQKYYLQLNNYVKCLLVVERGVVLI